jgi:hypothetical protein
MVPKEVIVSTEIHLVAKVPEIVKSLHASSNAVTKVTKVEEPSMKIAALSWTMVGRLRFGSKYQSTTNLKPPPPTRPPKTMPYVRKDNAPCIIDCPNKKIKKSKLDT